MTHFSRILLQVKNESIMTVFNAKGRQWIDKDESLPLIAKAEFHERKSMLCIWWDHPDIIHFEF